MQPWTFVVLVGLALTGCVVGQDPRCRMPQQYEARRIEFDPNGRRYHNHTSAFRSYGRYSYDADGLRKRIVEDYTPGGESTEALDILELYREKVAYVVDLKTKECRKVAMSHEFHHHDIPEGAEFIGYETLGAYPNQIKLSQWSYNSQAPPPHDGHHYLTYTAHQCAPVRIDRFNTETGFRYEEYSDFTEGIHDPNIWFPPQSCQHLVGK